MGIDIIQIAVAAIVFTAIYLIIAKVPFFAPFKDILLIVLAAIAAIFVLVRVIAPLFSAI